ncbi:Lipoprotein signal peptidase [Rickettsiales endosymbiont of Paramecium tredecaurelia]|uniref:signal peptidase II n=1 Tax=Candidatus Sarmatiella mevalonica TaxID=2770581 RepID=UPI0019211890|nr:signal peptidase II [Candidatus Sarmatiella mevalonica]MBL3284237.1 Lipoprotein signal peptidase [Candidatus Sarmatiella mevalonica]
MLYNKKIHNALIIFGCGIDQLAKNIVSHLLITNKLSLHSGFLDFAYSWNYGISFGLFKEYYQYSNYVFFVIGCAVAVFLHIKTFSKPTLSYALVLAGAYGNLIDRVVNGAVFDFISVHFLDFFYFPIFNFADVFIFFGVCLIAYQNFIQLKPKVELKNNS